jgi:hypothetical protein
MTRGYIAFSTEDSELIDILIPEPIERYEHFPIVVAEMDEFLSEVLPQTAGVHVHSTEFAAYGRILRALDRAAGMRSQIINLSMSPGPYAFDPGEAINVATRMLAADGHARVRGRQ